MLLVGLFVCCFVILTSLASYMYMILNVLLVVTSTTFRWLGHPLIRVISFLAASCHCNVSQVYWSHIYACNLYYYVFLLLGEIKKLKLKVSVQPVRWVLLALQFVGPKSCKSFFVLTKHVSRKRSFTEVALNSVLEENAIDFAWEFCWNFCRIFILQFNLF